MDFVLFFLRQKSSTNSSQFSIFLLVSKWKMLYLNLHQPLRSLVSKSCQLFDPFTPQLHLRMDYQSIVLRYTWVYCVHDHTLKNSIHQFFCNCILLVILLFSSSELNVLCLYMTAQTLHHSIQSVSVFSSLQHFYKETRLQAMNEILLHLKSSQE